MPLSDGGGGGGAMNGRATSVNIQMHAYVQFQVLCVADRRHAMPSASLRRRLLTDMCSELFCPAVAVSVTTRGYLCFPVCDL